MTKQADFMSMLQQPAAEINGMVTGISPTQRLQMAMRQADDANPTKIPDTDWSNSRVGVPNPYGRGLSAFEPNNVIFEGYAKAKGESDAANAKVLAEQEKTVDVLGSTAGGAGAAGGAVLGAADGKMSKAIQAALALAQRAVPYVWGGTTANGVDCSGLLYYALNSAGIKVPRYRAVDWGRIGQAVTVDQARPGDVVYYDEPGDTDHVGLYVGNGLMVQAPQSGDHVRVTPIGKPTSIRRIYDDASFGQVATPTGGIATSYNGLAYDPSRNATVSPPLPTTPGSTIYRSSVGRTRPI